jgi:outer membrane protein assembly factor BamB
MPICLRCRHGFDGDVTHCPNCGAVAPATIESTSDSLDIRKLRKRYYYLSSPQNFWKVLIGSIVLLGIGKFAVESALNYLNEPQQSLIAIDAKTGKVAWTVPLDLPGDSITTLGDRVFVSVGNFYPGDKSKRYQIRTFSATTGQSLWSYNPSVAEFDRSSGLYGAPYQLPLSAAGDTLWMNASLYGKYQTGPTVDPQLVAAGKAKQKFGAIADINQGKIIALDPKTGKPRWTLARDWYSVDGLDRMGVASSGDRTAILRITPTQKVWLETYQTATGKKLWQIPLSGSPRWEKQHIMLYLRRDLVANKDGIFSYNSFDGTIECRDWVNGKLKYTLKVGGLRELNYHSNRAMLITESTLYYHLSSERGDYQQLEAVDSKTGLRRWVFYSGKDGEPMQKCSMRGIESASDELQILSDCFVETSQTKLFTLDNKTGRKKLEINFNRSTSLERFRYGELLPSEPSSLLITSALGSRMVRFSSGKEQPIWDKQYAEDEISIHQSGISTTSDRIFAIGTVPRRLNLQSSFENRHN